MSFKIYRCFIFSSRFGFHTRSFKTNRGSDTVLTSVKDSDGNIDVSSSMSVTANILGENYAPLPVMFDFDNPMTVLQQSYRDLVIENKAVADSLFREREVILFV